MELNPKKGGVGEYKSRKHDKPVCKYGLMVVNDIKHCDSFQAKEL